MRDFLLRMYAFMRRLSEENGLQAAVAVALAMLEKEDRLAGHNTLLRGGIYPEQLSPSLLDEEMNPSLALGAAIALKARAEGCVVVAPVPSVCTQEKQFPHILQTALDLHLPIVFLMECDEDFPDDLEAQAVLGEIERIQADSHDAMRLMPALRVAIDRARESDGPTLIECVCGQSETDRTPAEILADVLITEGFATPEELL